MPRAWATAALMGSAWEKHTTTPPAWAAHSAPSLRRSAPASPESSRRPGSGKWMGCAGRSATRAGPPGPRSRTLSTRRNHTPGARRRASLPVRCGPPSAPRSRRRAPAGRNRGHRSVDGESFRNPLGLGPAPGRTGAVPAPCPAAPCPSSASPRGAPEAGACPAVGLRCRSRRCYSHQIQRRPDSAQSAGISKNPSIPRPVEVYGGGVSDRPEIFTVGELRASGHVHKDLRREIRDNLLAALAAGRDPCARDVRLQPHRPAPARTRPARRHDVVLLGERGQGKTRLLRTLAGLLDEWSPVIEDSELNEHPYEPLTELSAPAPSPRGTGCGWRGGTAPKGTSRSSRLRTPPSRT